MVERLQSARRHVDALRSALISPSPYDIAGCLPALEEAVACLQSVERELQAAHRNTELLDKNLIETIETEGNALKESLAITRKVITQGASFYEGWLRVLGAAAAGYTREGEPAALAPSATVSVKG